ncbi:MAG TPA: DUF3971 domain-containing protein [Caulobacterales bacterium]|nr:DUF3971 domain-containing protein [Caulobacterales bacterium]
MRRVIQRSTVLALEVFVGLLATLGLGVGLLYWRLAAGPIELASVKQHIEAQLSEVRGGRPVTIDHIELALGRGGGALQLRATGVRALDSGGKVLSQSREVMIGLAPERLLIGKVAVVEADFIGGDVTVTAMRGGGAQIVFGPPGAAPDIVLPPPKTTQEPLQTRVNRLLDGLAAAFRPVGPGGSLRVISIERARLTLIDEAGGARWVGDDAAFNLRRSKSNLSFMASASLNSPQGPAPFTAVINTDTSFAAATIDLTITGARPQALAPNLAPLAGLSTPLTLKVAAALDRKTGVKKLDGDLQIGAGQLALGGGTLALSGGKLAGRYDLGQDTLYVTEVALAGAQTKLRGQAKLEHASALFAENPAAPARYEVVAQHIDFQMPGAFSGPLAIDGVVAAGVLRPEQSAIEIEKFEANIDQARLRVAGRVFWGADGAGMVRAGMKLDGDMSGALAPQTIVRYWPINLGHDARAWCADSLKSGRLSNLALHVDFKPSDLASGALPDDKLSLAFDFEQAGVNYIEKMTNITGAQGRAELRGNSFHADVVKGTIGDIALTTGKVTLPRLFPAGAVATYQAHATGSAKSIVNLLREAPIGLDARLPFDPASIVGKGEADFAIRRPLGAGMPGDSTQFSVDGRFENVGATAKNGDYAISNWKLRVLGDDNALTLSGPMALARSTADLVWTEKVRAKENPSTVTLKGRLDADDIISLGFPILKYASGPVLVEARSTGVGLDINRGDVKLDFAAAAVNIEKGFWKKAPGAPATLKFSVVRQPDASLLMTGMEARGGGVNVNGQARVAKEGDLIEANLPQAFLPGAFDGSVSARRDEAGTLQANVKGAFLNIGTFFAPEPPKAPTADQMLATVRGYTAKPGALSPNYVITADVDRLRFRSEADLNKGQLVFGSDGLALRRLLVAGLDPQGKPFDLAITPAAGGGAGKLYLKSEDAGFAARAIVGVDNVKGGKVEATGLWTFGENPTAVINVKARTFLVSKVPAMAHLLSSVASLTGMVETLNGQGISFTDLDAPMTMADGKLMLTDCRAAGPSLGITAKGAVNLSSGALDIDGVLVPSYGLNSFLGNLPILGDLLVSRRGEGIFGITYSVHGDSQNPRVGVNPLSAITPGILRRIFEPARKPPPEKAG